MEWEAVQKPAEAAESRLIIALLDGTFPIGTTLPPERELAAGLGVTRTTLREVMQRLARDGWIEIHHGRATRVRNYWEEGNLGVLNALARFPELAPDDFVPNLLAVRRLLAPAYARLAVAQAQGEVVVLLEDMIPVEESPREYARVDWDLHHRLARLSANPIFTLILNGFSDLYRTMALRYFESGEARKYSRKFYSDLLEACIRKDLDQVESITTEAMIRSEMLWKQRMTGDTAVDGGA